MEWVVLDPCDQALQPEEVEQELYINPIVILSL